MRLTNILSRWAPRLPKGHIFRGKYRLVKRVTPSALRIAREEFEIEEKNMFYLRHPYLTPEQSYGHAKPFKHGAKFIEKHKENNLKWREHRTLGDRFGFLKVSDAWE